jgi:hypothetical protein
MLTITNDGEVKETGYEVPAIDLDKLREEYEEAKVAFAQEGTIETYRDRLEAYDSLVDGIRELHEQGKLQKPSKIGDRPIASWTGKKPIGSNF